MDETVERYLAEIHAATDTVDRAQLYEVADVLTEAWRRGRTVYTLGNGGSAALASHLACDLGKNTSADLGHEWTGQSARRLRIIGLADNAALLTALGNDVDFADIYVEQLRAVLDRGDVVLAISGSGSSSNVLRAMQYARTVGATTVAFTGARASAEPMIALADHVLVAPVEIMEQIEDLHVIFNHVLAVVLRARIAERSSRA